MPALLRIIIRPRVAADVDDLSFRIGLRNERAGDGFIVAVRNAENDLRRFPRLGRPFPARDKRLRELRTCTVPGYRRYVIVYRVVERRVEILRVMHGARDLRALRFDESGTDLRAPDEA
jgi:toxin ParE1/3/4